MSMCFKGNRVRKGFSVFMALMFVFIIPRYVSAAKVDFSMEDLYVSFGEVTESENVMGLPTWVTLTTTYQDIDKPIEVGEDKDVADKLVRKRQLAQSVVLGFDKSSAYTKWVDRVKKLGITYDATLKEVIINSSGTVTEEQSNELASIKLKFDSCMTKAEVIIMTGGEGDSYDLGGLGRVMTTGTSIFISIIRAIMFEIGRIGITLGSLVFVCELLYVSVEPLRPFLGFETKPIVFKRRNTETGLDMSVRNHGHVFRLVGKAARDAVESEFAIENSSEIIKNNLVISFIVSKIKYLVCIVGGIVLINTNIWGWICIKIIDVGAAFLG